MKFPSILAIPLVLILLGSCQSSEKQRKLNFEKTLILGFVDSESLLNVVITDMDRENVVAAAKVLQSKRDRDFDFLLIAEAKLPATWEPQWRAESIRASLDGLSAKAEKELLAESNKRDREYAGRLLLLLDLIRRR